MIYALMIYMDPTAAPPDGGGDAPASSDRGAVFADWTECAKAMLADGVLIAGEGLAGPETTTSVRVRNGEALLTDGPFVESKELLVGFYLLDTPDLDTALDWAARLPSAPMGTVEVRPIMPGPHSTLEILADA